MDETKDAIPTVTDVIFEQMNGSQNTNASFQMDSAQLPQIPQILWMPFETPELFGSPPDEEQMSSLHNEFKVGHGESWVQHDSVAMIGSVRGDAVTSEANETHGTVEGEGSIVEGRVDIDSLPVLSNPLQK